jgi:hypothetical protein
MPAETVDHQWPSGQENILFEDLMDQRVTELHCIMPMSNLASVVKHGLLSYERASALPHDSVAMQPVQDRRDKKDVPGGLKLHQYANLYFHARNPMLYKRLNEASSLTVLSVSTEVFNLPGTVMSDQNAASDYARFLSPDQWQLLDFDAIYAMNWKHPDDQIAEWRHKSRKFAEVLVPHRIESRFLRGAYVIDVEAQQRLGGLGVGLPIAVTPLLFFR